MEKTNKNRRHKQALLVWLSIYPLITFLYTLTGSMLADLTLPLKTLVLTLIAVPVMSYGMLPLLNRLLSGWLNK